MRRVCHYNLNLTGMYSYCSNFIRGCEHSNWLKTSKGCGYRGFPFKVKIRHDTLSDNWKYKFQQKKNVSSHRFDEFDSNCAFPRYCKACRKIGVSN